jgi:hypothetical protein
MRAETNLLFQDDGSTKFTFDLAGTGSGEATAVDWVATSDINLKRDWKPYGSVLNKIESLGVDLLQRFVWKDTNRDDVGYMICMERYK